MPKDDEPDTVRSELIEPLAPLADGIAQRPVCPSCASVLPPLNAPGFNRWRWNGASWEHDCGSWRPPA